MAKRAFGKTVDQYSDVLGRAFQLAWKEKTLWVFGLLAALLNTGSIFTTVVHTMRRVEPADTLSEILIAKLLYGVPWVLTYVRNLLSYDTTRVLLTVVVIVLFTLLFLFLTIASQQLLLSGLHHGEKRKKPLSFARALRSLDHLHVVRLFAINALSCIAIHLTLLLIAFPLSLFLGMNTLPEALIFLPVYLLLIPIAFTIDALAMFTLIRVVRYDEGLGAAFSGSVHMLRSHWLMAFEVGILLYIVNLILPVFLLAIASVFGVFVSVMGYATLATGTALLLAVLSVSALVVVILFFLASTGFLVTVNYAVWWMLFTKLERGSIVPALEYLFGGVLRFLKRLS